ncbi:hypothetical protein AAG570_002538 [Ranatra chinensis]|uniref:Uncharacterized protein n=1 Tax=Ranatra chinensis TaxID=642074 RepID=A0ABD0YUJ0_9HEMI
MASKRRKTFYKNKKQETTCNLPPFCDYGAISLKRNPVVLVVGATCAPGDTLEAALIRVEMTGGPRRLLPVASYAGMCAGTSCRLSAPSPPALLWPTFGHRPFRGDTLKPQVGKIKKKKLKREKINRRERRITVGTLTLD